MRAASARPALENIFGTRMGSFGPRGFEATLLAWRRATTAATLDFLDDIIGPGS